MRHSLSDGNLEQARRSPRSRLRKGVCIVRVSRITDQHIMYCTEHIHLAESVTKNLLNESLGTYSGTSVQLQLVQFAFRLYSADDVHTSSDRKCTTTVLGRADSNRAHYFLSIEYCPVWQCDEAVSTRALNHVTRCGEMGSVRNMRPVICGSCGSLQFLTSIRVNVLRQLFQHTARKSGRARLEIFVRLMIRPLEGDFSLSSSCSVPELQFLDTKVRCC